MKVKLLIVTALAMVIVFTFTACQQTDVIGNVSKTSFEALVTKMSGEVAADEASNSWSLTSPAGERFLWSKDLAGTPDAAIEFDATPFISAGLDAAKLPTEIYTYNQANNKITIAAELGSPKAAAKADATAADSFKQLVDTNREAIGYHAKLDHYGVALGNGNMFEWAKDMSTNDKDIVFVLNPQPFIDAGVDTAKLTDWVFTKVPVMDENNKEIEVEKFLKPYEISK
ncbi:MAG: hypothetical protein K0Q99_1705 [Clostridia bacterium]|jgi:hypothetical protein|nr:hypothetical protein [Clostridia bacterium]